jgi:hypothetical protein
MRLEHREDARPKPVAFAVAVSEDRAWATIGLAGVREDGNRHVQIVRSGRGTGWLPDALTELIAKWKPSGVAIDPGSPAGSLLPVLEQSGIEVTTVAGRQVAAADGGFFDAVAEKTIRHASDAALNISVRAARKQPRGDAWVFRTNEPDTDIGPLNAVSLALYVLSKGGRPRTGQVIGVR